MSYEHEVSLQGVDYASLPRGLKAKINRFIQMRKALEASPNEKKQIELMAFSAVIADEIQDFVEKDFPDSAPLPQGRSPEEKAEQLAEYNRQKTKRLAKLENNGD